jgi:hypothetical protein
LIRQVPDLDCIHDPGLGILQIPGIKVYPNLHTLGESADRDGIRSLGNSPDNALIRVRVCIGLTGRYRKCPAIASRSTPKTFLSKVGRWIIYSKKSYLAGAFISFFIAITIASIITRIPAIIRLILVM